MSAGSAMDIDTSTWTKIGESANAIFYEIEPHALAIVPFDGSADDEPTAKESVRIQLDYLRAKGTRAGTIVFMDRLVAQDSAARSVYRDAPDQQFQVCFALIGGTSFGRAVASVFIGLHRLRVPTKMFGTYDNAIAWVRTMVAAT
ncbi:MAG: hypothetical protein ABIP89_20440 [Polyangiaceae bacterium]